MSDYIQLNIDGKALDCPIITGTEGDKAIDISKLRSTTGYITMDPGFGNTGACKSAITYIDGDQGILRYRGIPIEQLAERSDFVEVAWLLIFGKLPSAPELERFRHRLANNSHLNEAFKHHFEGFPVDAPPMAMLGAMINTLSCFHQQFLQIEGNSMIEEAAARLLAKVATIAAYIYRRTNGLPYIYPDPKLKYVGNFLHMMFSMPYEQYIAHPEV